MHIIGTAGHVDHGKSSLVQALTGTNPDRWIEEQLRGMTLDLGFALLRFDDGTEAGIVDVPGHERFLHNMLAGASGMELLLLVVDVLEGVRPQTVEHLQILQYLNVRESIVVVTKSDLLEPLALQDHISRIHTSLQGTIVQDARMIAVSSVTGENLPLLREAIHQALLRLPPRPVDAPAFLPVDRVFALAGLGTIVTGTLMQGRIALGDTLTLQPLGENVRVRSLQSFNRKQDAVTAGSRVAVNIPSVAASAIERGEVLAAQQFRPSDAFAVEFMPLHESLPLLRRRNAVRAYLGSAEILGTLILNSVPDAREAMHAQLFLKTPAIAYPGMAFVVRRLSPKNLLGGGHIAGESVRQHDGAPAHDAILAALSESQPIIVTAEQLAQRVNLQLDAVQHRLDELVERGDAIVLSRPKAYAASSAARAVLDRALACMRERQAAEPWSLGTTSLWISRALQMDEGSIVRLLAAYAEEGVIALRAGYFSSIDHVPALSDEQRAFFDASVAGDPANPFAPVDLAAVVAEVKRSRIAGIAKAFDTLVAKGALVKVNEHLYRGAQISAIRARVETYLRSNGRMTMAEFRDLIGTSRKYAVPLLEWFDTRGITVRSGDYRMLREKPHAGSPRSG